MDLTHRVLQFIAHAAFLALTLTTLNILVFGVIALFYIIFAVYSHKRVTYNKTNYRYYHYPIFGIFNPPKKVINSDNGNKYWVGFKTRIEKNDDPEIIFVMYEYKYLFWVPYFKNRIWLRQNNFSYSEKIEHGVKETIDSYEKMVLKFEIKRQKEREKNLKDTEIFSNKFKSWDGIVGNNKKAYRRKIKLEKLENNREI